MRNIRTEWFYNEKSPKEIKCRTVELLKNKEDALCYLLALNLGMFSNLCDLQK
ncbi:hypothetical protein [Spiroplasma endosymbiont of Danaus chrysippus]|uniref:hypothetical protein n=1 Tax=Spiroplasma endosymbiont of Danaus chrysippus TaxID=2691041 RepID=UPI00157A88A7|nr:hypothetical protein [Spiroplasma endosymbiont of Danaus chrysippus]